MKSKLYPFFENKTGFILPTKIESIDIDDLEDLDMARKLIK